MKHLDDDLKLLRNAKTKVGSKRYVELIPLGEEYSLGSWASLGNPSGSYNGLSSTVHEGKLYVGLETSGHIFRFDGPNTWTDMGQPSGATSINTLRSYNHKLYANGDNGEVYRFDGIGNWTYVGNAGTCMVYTSVVYYGNLYVGTCGSGKIYHFDKVSTWGELGITSPEAIRCLLVYNDRLYAGADDGHIYEYGGGETWTTKEETPRGAGIHSLVVFKNEMYCGVSGGAGAGHVFRYYGGRNWEDCGRLGTSTNVPALVSFGGRLYGGADDGKVYRYDGHTTWTEIVHLGSGTCVNSFTTFEGRLYATASTSSGNVYRVENQPGTVLDISSYVANVGKVTNRLERKLNQFQPKAVSVDLMDDEFFFKSDKTGILDYDNLKQGYQLKVHVGLTGSNQWILMFDGKVNPDSAKSIDRETGVFTAISWLDEAKNISAEVVADPDNSPFKNISGLVFLSCTADSRVGAKKMQFGWGETYPWISLDKGEKVDLPSYGTYTVFDPMKESGITLEVLVGNLPEDSEEDSFSVKEHEGTLIACGWWENILLGGQTGAIAKIAHEIGITDLDIRIDEIEEQLGTLKDFTYLSTPLPKGEITCARIVEIIDTPYQNKITMIIGTEKSSTQHYLYKVSINWVDKTIQSLHILNTTSDRIVKVLRFANKWFVVRAHKYAAAAPTEDEWQATYIYGLDSNFDIDYTYDIDANLGSIYDACLACSASVLGEATTSLYMIGNKQVTSNYYAKLFKLTWGGASLSHTFIVNLEYSPTNNNNITADQRATILPQTTQNYYWYGIRDKAAYTMLRIKNYGLTTGTFDKQYSLGAYNRIANFTRNIGGSSSHWQGYFKQRQNPTSPWHAYWIGEAGDIYYESDSDKIKNIIYANQDYEKYYMYWFYEQEGYKINQLDSLTGQEYKQGEKLDSKYSISEVAPMVFSGSAGDHNYVGFVKEDVTNTIVPFLYMPTSLTVSMDLTGMSCEKALTRLAEAHCCAVDIYGKDKMRFYFREEYNAEDTIDYDDYLKPQKRDYWKNWCGGVIVENKEKGIKFYAGNIHGKVIKVNSPFISSYKHARQLGLWLSSFFGKKRLLFSINVPFYIEPELLDKIILFLKDKDGNAWRSYNTIVYETSFNVSPGDKKSHNMELKLLEIGGEVVHVKNVMPIDSNKITVET